MSGEIVHVTKAGTEVVRFGYPDGPRNTADIAREQALCFQLRIEHYTIRQIAAMTGLSIGTVHARINDEIERTVAPYREKCRVYARERWDGISRRILDLMDQRKYLVVGGKLVIVDDEPVVDHEFQLHCIDRLMAVERQRAASEGYAVPDESHSPSEEVLPDDIELAGLIRKARERADAQKAALREVG